MSAPLFFVEALAEGASVALRDDDARHAMRALRLRPGDEVVLADGAGAMARGTLGSRGGQAIVEVHSVVTVARPAPALCVALAPPKGDRLTWAVQKLTEVGADEIALIESDRAVRRWTGEREGHARRRLEAVAREAAMQSRRPFVPTVSGPWTVAQALEGAAAPARVVVLWERAEKPLAGALEGEAVAVRLVVGPEGGFTDDEIAAAGGAGAALASLGFGILRTETAALAGAVVALHRLGRLG